MTARVLLEATTILLLLAVALPIAWLVSMPRRASKVVAEICEKLGKPRLRRIWITRYTVQLAFKMPTLATASRFITEREAIETKLNCSVEIWEREGLVRMRFGVNPLPREITYGAFYGR